MGVRRLLPYMFVFTSFLIIIVFQNCSESVEFTERANSENPFGTGTTRKILLDPNLAENRPPIHLTTIIDNSYSTSEIQEQMNQGFAKVVDQVKGFNVVANLYTTSHDDNADKSSTQYEDVIVYKDSQGQDVTLMADEINRVPANTSYTEKKVFSLVPSFFSDRKPLSYDFGLGEFDSFKESYFRAVSNLGTNGADKEQGLCTLLRKLEDNRTVSDPENRAFHVYMLASNENDFTTLDDCLVEDGQETTYKETTKTVNCALGAPGCTHNYKIDQNPDSQQDVKLNYSRDNATVKVAYQGRNFHEQYIAERQLSTHKIQFERKEAKYTYQVIKICTKDNIPVPCTSPTVKTKTVYGSCSFSGSRQCNGGDQAAALQLLGLTSSSDMHSCQVSCSQAVASLSVPSQQVPDSKLACTTSQKACDSQDLTAASLVANASISHIQNCSRTCSTETIKKTKTIWHRVNSCSTVSRACNANEVETIAAPRLEVSPEEVTSCHYKCKEGTRSGIKTLLSNQLSCSSHPARSCSDADKDWLISKKIGVKKENIDSCDVSCSSSLKNYSIDLNVNPASCVSSQACSANEKALAANEFSGDIGDLKSCEVSCSQQTVSKPSCLLTDMTHNQLCSENNSLMSLCTSQGRGDLNFSSCQLTQSKKTDVAYQKSVGAKTKFMFNQMPGVTSNDSVAEIVAKRLKAVHGANGFYTSFFTYPKNSSSCQPPSYLSSGDRYEELVSILGANNAKSYPVCLEDYSPALDVVIKLAIDNVLTNFNLDLEELEEVFLVEGVLLDGTIKEFSSSDYEVFKETIRFKNKELLKDVTSLELSVWNP